MKTRTTQTSTSPRHREAVRSGFTLLELLAVIVIIAILIALIFPAIQGAIRNARNAEVSAEIMRFETAIASFKAEYNIEPWSEIVLTEDPSVTAWTPDARTKIRRIWPQFDFTSTNDFNDDSTLDGDSTPADSTLTLEKSECLVFFLGGMRDGDTVVGFSMNPISPFNRTGDNRTDRLFEFDVDRFVDTDDTPDGMLEYLDPLPGQTEPYHFVSSNNGQGYSSGEGHYLDGSDQPWKPDSHQIISPGEDGNIGQLSPVTPVYTPGMDLSGDRQPEADNIANFSGGTLN